MKQVLRMPIEFKNKLIQVGAYEEWLSELKNLFKSSCTIEEDLNKLKKDYIKTLQKNINGKNYSAFISNSFTWSQTKKGYEYWKDVIKKLENL